MRAEADEAPLQAPAVELRGVGQLYRSRDGVLRALDAVSITIREGEFLVIVGPSGCGKTTLLKMVAGLIRPTEGEVRIGGRPVTGPVPGIGMVFQNPVLLRWRTVLGNVLLPVEILRLDRGHYEAAARETLRLVGLEGFENRRPSELSGGMQQRAALARALVHDPTLLLMDEPFGALDQLTREQMNLELLRIWGARRITTLLITHSVQEAVLLGDRVVVMTPRPGRVAEVVEIDLPRPRTAEMQFTAGFASLAEQIAVRIRLGG
ncbi:MAG TPA: ABC transporter ATP-binding protein [Candidatus Dormibacteraeota bacterium]|nr:ABC transporter ATP-binding protein [Candidatus Dormibacteraeota bacterium]